jgi:hypothetical protein
MAHTEAQPIPVVTSTYARLINLFEALWDAPGHSETTLLEVSTPGATQALRDWAVLRGFDASDRVITPPGVPAFRIVKVTAAKSRGVSLVVSVQGARGVES